MDPLNQHVIDERGIEELLGDFRAWLAEAAAAGTRLSDLGPEAPTETVDMATLVGQFTALRHEVNLQTRAARGQQEQTTQALDKLHEALELAREARKDSTEPALPLDQGRAVVKALLDAFDALALARREVTRIRETLAELRPFPETATAGILPTTLPPLAQPPVVRLPWWARWLGLERRLRQPMQAWEGWLAEVAPRYQGMVSCHAALATAQRELDAARQGSAEQFTTACTRLRQGLDSLLAGYAMSVQRLERTLEQLGLEAIAAAGEAFDPEVMEAVEVVVNPDRFGTIVLEEVRRGYLWRGRVLRYAQVRVEKGLAGQEPDQEPSTE